MSDVWLMPGTVVSFDEEVGLGLVETSGTGERYGFHCTQIAGGGRSIAAGTPVRFEVRPGRKGVWEAFEVTAMASADPGSA
jgi:cold shock CspA family protein